MLNPNQLFQKGRYRIIKLLSETEYEVFDNLLETNVLFKEIHDYSGKFVQNVAVLKTIRHDSIFQVQNTFSESGKNFLVHEKPDGDSLSAVIEKNKSPFTLKEIWNWTEQILNAIGYLHSQNPPIFYGNLSPQNLSKTSNGKVKLLPDSIIQHLETSENNASENQQFDAKTLAFSPLEKIWKGLDPASQKVIFNSFDEQAENFLEQAFNAQSDIYALGATIYYLSTAKLPIDALSRSIEIIEGKRDPLPPPKEINPRIPHELSDFMLKALEIKRENRFSSAQSALQNLRTALAVSKRRELNLITGKVDENVLEIPSVNPAIQPQRQIVKQIEGEQQSQIEIIKQQLREAEAKRIEAEQRAAKAEQRLLERESQTFSQQDFAEVLSNSSEKTIDVSIDSAIEKSLDISSSPVIEESNDISSSPVIEESNDISSSPVIEGSNDISSSPVIEESNDYFGEMLSQPEKNNKFLVKMAVGAVILLAIGGAGFGVWTYSESPQTNQSSLNTTFPPVQTIEPASLPTPAPLVAKQTEESPSPKESSDDSATSETIKTPTNPAPAKSKTPPSPTPPQTAKKQTPQPAKPAEIKKKVTLDDLLKDN
jgi:serine/threonine protein kinase